MTWAVIAEGIVYRKDKIPTPPKSYKDFLKPEYKGHVGFPVITNGYGMDFLIMLAKAHGGGEDNIEPGFEAMKKIKGETIFKAASDLPTLFGQGDIWIMPYDTGNTFKVQQSGLPVAFATPDEGSPAVFITACVAKGAKNADVANAAIDAMLKPEAQIEIARTMRWTASNPDTKLPADLAGEVPRSTGWRNSTAQDQHHARGLDRSLEPGNRAVTGGGAKGPRRSRFHALARPGSAVRAVCAGLRRLLHLAAGLAARDQHQRQGRIYARALRPIFRRPLLLGDARPHARDGPCGHADHPDPGLPTAYVLARMQSRWAGFLLLLTTFPLLVSAVVRSFGWMVLFFKDGLVSRTLVLLGFVDRPVQLMYTMTGVIIALAQVLLPLMVLTLYGVFKSIDRDLEYAAMSLGARPSVALALVTLRLARGGIVAGSLLVFSLAISTFATPSLVGGARANVMATAIYEQTIELLDWPFGAALAAILLVVVLGLSLAYGALVEGRTDAEAQR